MTPSSDRNIFFLLCAQAKANPDHLAIISPGLNLPLHKLVRLIESYVDCFKENGVKRGDLVSIQTTDAIASITCVFALSHLGVRYIPFGAELLEDGAPAITHFARTIESDLVNTACEIVIDQYWSPKHRTLPTNAQPFQGFDCEDDICWISPSSGTSGTPKYTAISAALLLERVAAISNDYSARPTRLAMLFGPASRPFIIRAIAALCYGHTLVDSNDRDELEAADANFLCGSPQQLTLWLNNMPLHRKILKVQVSGAPLDDAAIAELFKSFECIEDVYGSNETIKAHINRYTRGADRMICKRGIEDQSTVQIVDNDDKVIPSGQQGIVRVKTPHMVTAYLGDTDATKTHFRDGWFYPGDIAKWEPDGFLNVLGRSGDILNIEGQKVLLSDIDAKLSDVRGVVAASSFAFQHPNNPTPIAACLVLKDGVKRSDVAQQSWLRCVDALGARAAPGLILVLRDQPLTPDGLLQRKRTNHVFLDTLSKADPIILNTHLFKFKVDFDE